MNHQHHHSSIDKNEISPIISQLAIKSVSRKPAAVAMRR